MPSPQGVPVSYGPAGTVGVVASVTGGCPGQEGPSVSGGVSGGQPTVVSGGQVAGQVGMMPGLVPVVPFGANVVPVQVPQGIQIPPPPLPCQGVPCQGVPCQSVPGMSVSGGSMFPSQRPPNFCGAPPVFDRVM